MALDGEKEMEYTTWPMPWEECLMFGEKMLRISDLKDGSKMEFSSLNHHSNLSHFTKDLESV
ncbi:hypothetical protein TB2_027170 [Malus domestica]